MKGLMGLVVLFSAVLMLAGVSFAGTVPILSFDPGDVGSPECLAVQQEAQETVGPDSDAYRNHGQMVRRAAHVVDPAVDSGEITEECASCIMNQFARKSISFDEQERCGEEAVACPCFSDSTIDEDVLLLTDLICLLDPDFALLQGFSELGNYVAYVDRIAQGGYCFFQDDRFEVFEELFPLLEEEVTACFDVLFNSEMWNLNCLED